MSQNPGKQAQLSVAPHYDITIQQKSAFAHNDMQNMSRHVLHCSLYADFISFLALDIVSLEKDDPV